MDEIFNEILKLYNYGFKILRNKELVEEAIQETAIEIFKMMMDQDQLLRLFVNACQRVKYNEDKRSFNELEGDINLDFGEMIEEDDSFEEVIFLEEIYSKFLDDLTDNQRWIMKKKEEGYSTREISQELGIAESTVRVTLFRLKNKLIQTLCNV